MSADYSGRNVVVTGATGELGEAVARLLLQAGAMVHVPARDPDKALGLYGGDDGVRVAKVSDLGDEAEVTAFYATLPPLWASIHCAGSYKTRSCPKTSPSACSTRAPVWC